MKTRIKICGITTVQDAGYAVAAGADAIGLVFYRKSPRNIDEHAARKIVESLPPFVTTVGLFVDADNASVQQVLNAVPLDLLQFHGNETAEFCNAFSRPYIKAVRVRDDTDFHAQCTEYETAAGLLLDSYKKGVPGGTGDAFNWNLIPRDLPLPVILAGGLNPLNVADAIAKVSPFAVDVSSGVEQVPGRKDEQAVHAFARAVLGANHSEAL